MFDFFRTIFIKITSAIASVIIAVGLVSVPAPQPELPPQPTAVVELKQDTQQLKWQQELTELEKARAETAKAKAETKKAQREVEEARVKTEQERLTAQDAQIKIEICKIEAQTSIKNFLEAGKMAANEGFQKCVQNRFATLQQQLGGGGVAPGTIDSMVDLARSSCRNSAQKGLDFLQSKADEMYNQQYLVCLNK